jgi:hypothetical protein
MIGNMKLKKGLLGTTLVFGFVGWAMLCHAEVAEFHLASEKVGRACYGCEKGEYFVNFQLKEPYKTEFANLTESLIGELLALVYAGKRAEVLVQGRINSGHIGTGGFKTLEEATDAIREVLPDVPEEDLGPCNPRFWPCDEWG